MQIGIDNRPIVVSSGSGVTYGTEHEFWEQARLEFNELVEKQMPWLEQSTPMYTFVIDLLNRLNGGTVIMKPDTLEYYSISDADLHCDLVDDREKLLEDMRAADSAFEFLAKNVKYYKISKEDDQSWRRTKVFG